MRCGCVVRRIDAPRTTWRDRSVGAACLPKEEHADPGGEHTRGEQGERGDDKRAAIDPWFLGPDRGSCWLLRNAWVNLGTGRSEERRGAGGGSES